MKPLEGLRVIELAGVLAGPSAGMFLAELGARVIKIENTLTGGDITRKWKLPIEDPDSNVSAYYASVNLYKEVKLLDLREEEGLAECRKLIGDADIVLVNFREGEAIKKGLDYETLSKVNPALIYASITGFPGSSRPAFDVVLQAETGFMSMNGEPGSMPLKLPVAFIDLFAGHQLKEAILLALLEKEKSGRGSKISVSLFKSAVASLANQASNYLHTSVIPERSGSLHPNIAPYGETFRTSDNKLVVLAVGNDEQFVKLSIVAGADWHCLPDFETNQERVKNRKVLEIRIQDAFSLKSSKWIETEFSNNRIPFGFVKNLSEVFEDPAARSMIREERNDSGEVLKSVSGIAFDLHYYDNTND